MYNLIITFCIFASFSLNAKTKYKYNNIISLSLASDEVLIEILSKANQLQRLKAISTLADNIEYSNITSAAKKIPYRVGKSIEVIAKLKADFAILSYYNRPEFKKRLDTLKIKTLRLGEYKSINDIILTIKSIGKVLQLEHISNPIIKNFTTELKKLRVKTKKRVIFYSPSNMFPGKDTIFSDFIDKIGAINVASEIGVRGWQKITAEKLASLDVDVIITTGNPKNRAAIIAKIKQHKSWKLLYQRHKKKKYHKLIIVNNAQLNSISSHLLTAARMITQRMNE